VISRSPVISRSYVVTEIALLLNEIPLLPSETALLVIEIALLVIEITVGPGITGGGEKSVSASVP
jgi:hypothetical protein